ncbi:MAG TPA: cell division protein ZapB [Thermodesulfobacteriota bacterium]|nr:cell division protein ZapB [Deltaproteobacteria bacterium]HNR12515.1 cell division protein ZapB [Thermodesulfobacteriota bacterium]HNU72875.1 cell division protein ZapB [Thermodesulfobacteriota bacterium]
MTLEKFDVLEEKVRQLSERFAQLKNENEAMMQAIKDKDTEIESLKDKSRVLEEEREQIRSRLDKIIANLEDVSVTF